MTSSACHLASSRWAALLLALSGGCDGTPRGQDALSASNAERPVAEQYGPTFDQQAPGSENRVPFTSGAHGTLGYRAGCLFLAGEGGGETGLVIPSHARFDGNRLIGKVKKPTGESFVVELGQFVHLRGQMIDNPREGRYGCDTKMVLIVDYF